MSCVRHHLVAGAGVRALLFLFGLHATACGAATLSIGPPKAIDNGSAETPILFHAEKNEFVSSLQFEVLLAPTDVTWQSIVAGASASTGGKMVSFNRIESSRYRVIVAGFNQNVLQDGPVALIRLTSKSTQPILALENLVMSDPSGHAIRAKSTAAPPNPNTPSAAEPHAATSPTRPACGCGTASTPSTSSADLLVIAATSLLLLLCAHSRSAHRTRF